MKVFNLKSLALASLVASSAASAMTVPLPAGPLALEDDNLEYVIDVNGNIKTTGALEVGDTLYAFITFNSVVNPDNSTFYDFNASLELTGVSAITISSIAGGAFEFEPNADFESTYGSGALAALFAGSPADFGVDCHTGGIAACMATATNGDPWLTAGFGDDDDFWHAQSSIGAGFASIDFVAAQNSGINVATANYALSILENNTGTEFREQASTLSPLFTAGLGDNMTDIIGSGTVLGGAGLTSPFFARSDFDFTLDRIPEPGSIALLGVGLLLAGASRRRKTR